MPSPDQIGRYRVDRRLGSGAFAVVWLAHDDRLEAPVAVKVMADNWAHRMDIRERFLAEARLLRKASSGGVVQVFDVGELDDERPYFVMEYADRGTVADRMTTGPLPVTEALRLTSEAAHGAEALHESGVVHRDIKPSNVLLASGGAQGRERVLVADLGLAKNLAHASGLTVVAGSVGYMAPEQAEPFEGIDARADIYSLGAVFYHLVTGAVPGSPGRVMPLDELRPGLPWAVTEAVARAMEPDRERRWPTAAAFADELDRIATELDRNAAPADGPNAPDGPKEGPQQDAAGSGGSDGSDPLSGLAGEQGQGADGRDSLAPSAAQLSFLALRPASQVPGQSPTAATEPPSSETSVTGTSADGPSTAGPSAAGSSTPEGPTPEGPTPEGPVLGSPASENSLLGASAPQAPAPESAAAELPGVSRGTARPVRARRRRRAVAIGSAVVVLAGVGVASAVLLPDRTREPSTVRVHDASGQVSVQVPGVWAQEVTDSGWNPSSLGLPAKHAPGLLVAEDVGRWQDLTSSTSGVFVGLGYTPDKDGATKSPSPAPTPRATPNPQGTPGGLPPLPDKVTGLKHQGCHYTGGRNFKGGEWQGRIRTWSACDRPGLSLQEIGLTSQQKGKPSVYVQIRCSEDCGNRTDQVLKSLRVSTP
ncbi:protein kinase domain-containing protein [Streptomyces sp. 3N207]|uniref:protein kinase domain-containing protein n=1 Tax=Streptomyces sp. 3N207 TaxID=3457417 RepID=UPI003FD3E570